jgi:hypothetical protein
MSNSSCRLINFDQDPDMPKGRNRRSDHPVFGICLPRRQGRGTEQACSRRYNRRVRSTRLRQRLARTNVSKGAQTRVVNILRRYYVSRPFHEGEPILFAAVTGSDCVCELHQGDG